jgi:toxin-antitoxin system PIN domain toxin
VTALLASSVLVALAVRGHVHRETALAWLGAHKGRIATCPITQGSVVRALIRGGASGSRAQELLAALTEDERHDFWPDSIDYAAVPLRSVVGHRQVTDAYLCQLARANGGTLATFDRGLAAIHADVAELVE